MNDRVIFSIDDWSDLRKLARFLRHMADQQALGKLKGEFKVLQGSYKGVPEISFMCYEKDFGTFVKSYGWVEKQESYLRIFSDNSCYFFKENLLEGIGEWTQVTQDQKGENWTYDPKDNSWWTCI